MGLVSFLVSLSCFWIAHSKKPWPLSLIPETRETSSLIFASSLCNVDGKNKSKLARILTPMVYNSIWISWTSITLASMLYWSISLGMVFFDLQLKTADLIGLLEHAAKSWDRYHDFSKIGFQTMFNERDAIFVGLSNARRTIIGWSINLIVLAAALSIVSYDWTGWLGRNSLLVVHRTSRSVKNCAAEIKAWFLAQQFYGLVVRLLLRMLKQVLRIRDLSFLAEGSNRSSTMWAELEDEFREFNF